MRVAHVRERHAPAGAPWRLALAGPPTPGTGASGRGSAQPARWLDAEVLRRRLIAADPGRAHNAALFRQPLSTTDDLFARGLRLAALTDLLEGFEAAGGARGEDDEAVLDAADLRFGPPVLRPPAFRDFYAFEQHVRTMWERRGGEIPEAWYRLPIFYFSNTSEMRGPEDEVWAPRGSTELDFELEVGAVIDTPLYNVPADRAEEGIGGYFVLADWSARDLQREETVVRLGPAKGKDFATSIGPWIVTPDELAPARVAGATAPDLAMVAEVRGHDGRAVEVSRGTWASAQFSFGQMLERASADVHIRSGEIMGSGTVGGGSLLESRDETLGRWLEPGDAVRLSIERIGMLRASIVARP
ncbi:MAG TPA: fumarylacetoacetate hydrolase family protein, partial [Candidatus Limnocylindrales bacterium]|nr:fumarylacetoacetate hydrolase family protein [Candidatus Limnocylindrales bacterium]